MQVWSLLTILKRLQNENETAGLKKIIGKWDNFEEIEPEIKRIFKNVQKKNLEMYLFLTQMP